jgi:hypothetical protein
MFLQVGNLMTRKSPDSIFAAFSGYDEPRDQCIAWMHPCVPSHCRWSRYWKPGLTTSTDASKNSGVAV